jgi:murein L,D-transpeptidase YafK
VFGRAIGFTGVSKLKVLLIGPHRDMRHWLSVDFEAERERRSQVSQYFQAHWHNMKKLFAVLLFFAVLLSASLFFITSSWQTREILSSFVVSKLPKQYAERVVNASRVSLPEPDAITIDKSDLNRKASPDPAANASRPPLQKLLAARGFSLGQKAYLRLFKSESVLELWMLRGEKFELFESYPICSWSGQLGPKLREGDGQSPEGFYVVSKNHLNPNSKYYLAINVGYPNAFDQSLGRTGSALMIHGSCVSIGCYAMTDAGIDDIYRVVEAAMATEDVPIHIFPFRMTKANLEVHAGHKWIAFWRNLAAGDRLFQKTGLPPPAFACAQSYGFGKGSAQCTRIAPW